MKARCLRCYWRGDVASPEIKSCPLCGGELQHALIDTSKKGGDRGWRKEKKDEVVRNGVESVLPILQREEGI